MNRLSEMESFVAVVETGGFTEAARRLRLSKSAVSKQISALEDRLGARLLDRTTRNVAATEIGMSYYREATRVLKIASDADAMVASMQSAPQGRLRITAPLDLGQVIVAPIVQKFLRAYPDISVDLVLENRNVDLLAEKFDLAIRIGELADSSLIAKKLADLRMRIVAAPSYIDRAGLPESLQELEQFDLLHFAINPAGPIWNLQDEKGAVPVRALKSQFTANDSSSLLSAALDGLGIAYLGRFSVDDAIADGRLIDLFPDLQCETRPVHAVYQPGPYIQPKLRSFIDYLADAFKGVSV